MATSHYYAGFSTLHRGKQILFHTLAVSNWVRNAGFGSSFDHTSASKLIVYKCRYEEGDLSLRIFFTVNIDHCNSTTDAADVCA